jgi:hypothetical protein
MGNEGDAPPRRLKVATVLLGAGLAACACAAACRGSGPPPESASSGASGPPPEPASTRAAGPPPEAAASRADGSPALAAAPARRVVDTPLEVEVACGQCRFGLPGAGCDLALRVDGRACFVRGTGIDDHGDAHADDGFCKSVRRARVTGSFEGDAALGGVYFAVRSFELLPESSAERFVPAGESP